MWVSQGDFLLTDHGVASADYVLGNPPTSDSRICRPTATPHTAGHTPRCEDAVTSSWALSNSAFGSSLQAASLVSSWPIAGCATSTVRACGILIADGFSVEAVIEMHDVDAFEKPVSAYPAITVIRRAEQDRCWSRRLPPLSVRRTPTPSVWAEHDMRW